jgi:hypothetical protein
MEKGILRIASGHIRCTNQVFRIQWEEQLEQEPHRDPNK